jgi:predicted MFS family arabinose efflux permease
MGAFSVASVFGVYSALELAERGGWRLPFIVVAAMGVVIIVLALWKMPPMRAHLVPGATGQQELSALLADKTILLALAMNGLVMLTAFLVIPNIAPHLLQNLGFPRNRLGWGYMAGGAASFLIMRIAGRAIDRHGPARVSVVGTALLIGVLWYAFIAPGSIGVAGVVIVFVLFMAAMSIRNVAMSSLSTRVPRGDQRAGYMSLQSTAQHVSSATGAFVSSRLLHEAPGGRLQGIATISIMSALLAVGLPPMLAAIGRRVRERESAEAAPP